MVTNHYHYDREDWTYAKRLDSLPFKRSVIKGTMFDWAAYVLKRMDTNECGINSGSRPNELCLQ